MNQLELDKKKLLLKVEALVQSNARLANENAEYRVEITLLLEEVERLTAELTEAQNGSVEEAPADAAE